MYVKISNNSGFVVKDIDNNKFNVLMRNIIKNKEPMEQVEVFLGKNIFDGGEESYPFIFSTADIDRYGDIVVQEGIGIENYRKNNVVLWSHDHRRPAIGSARNVRIEGSLRGDFYPVSKDVDHFGWSIGEKIKSKIIKSGSVGLLVLEALEAKEGENFPGYKLSKTDLLEFSICNVPANPFALQMDWEDELTTMFNTMKEDFGKLKSDFEEYMKSFFAADNASEFTSDKSLEKFFEGA